MLLDGLVEEMGGNEEACGKFGQNSNDLEDRFQWEGLLFCIFAQSHLDNKHNPGECSVSKQQ